MDKQANINPVTNSIPKIIANIIIALVAATPVLYLVGLAVLNATQWLGGDPHLWLLLPWFKAVGSISATIFAGAYSVIMGCLVFVVLQLGLVMLACIAELATFVVAMLKV